MNLFKFLIAKVKYPFMKRRLQKKMNNAMQRDVRTLLKDKGQIQELGSRIRLRQQLGKMKHARNTMTMLLVLISTVAFCQQKDVDNFKDQIRRFDNQSTLGSSLFFAGAAGIGAGAFAIKNEDSKKTCYIISGSVSFVGLLIYMTAYKQFRYDARVSFEGDKLTYKF